MKKTTAHFNENHQRNNTIKKTMKNPTSCKKCKLYNNCINPDTCPKVGPILHRIEHGDQRYKKHRNRIEPVFQANMTPAELRSFNHTIYGAEEGIQE